MFVATACRLRLGRAQNVLRKLKGPEPKWFPRCLAASPNIVSRQSANTPAKEPEPGSTVHKANRGNEMAKSGQKNRRLKKFTLRPAPDLAE
jgi:hypothetical protein